MKGAIEPGKAPRKRPFPLRSLVLPGIASAIFGGVLAYFNRSALSSPLADRHGMTLVLGITAVVIVPSLVAAAKRGRLWKPLPPLAPKVLSVVDTVSVCGSLVALLVVAPEHTGFVLIFCCFGAAFVALAHSAAGAHVVVAELLEFYTSIPLLDVLTGKAPHDRIHPMPGHHGPWEANIYRIRSVPDFLGYVLVIVPTMMSTVAVKASALILGPLLYLGLSFDAQNYADLAFEAKRRWRSSFKTVALLLSLGSLAVFGGKVLLYVIWNQAAQWWTSSPILIALTRPVAPTAFLPWHLALPLQAALLFALMLQVDSVVHRMDDRGATPVELRGSLRLIRAGFRLRNILTAYVAISLLWLVLPWFASVEFPPITLSILPR